MFSRHGKKENLSTRKPVGDLIQIASALSILAEEKRSALVLEIEEACVLNSERHSDLCTPVLTNLINHCQLLPETALNYYSQPGGFLDHALNRTEAALTLFREFVLLEENQTEWSKEQSLWQYALYSAALLQGIGKLHVDYQVKCYDNKGVFLTVWDPLLTSLATAGAYYSYTFEKEVGIDLRRRLNLLLARKLMPENGFAWIASNREVLSVWLALLNEDFYGAGTLGAILIRADALALRRYFNQLLARGQGARGIPQRISSFSGREPVVIQDIENKIGAEFIVWLYKSLESGQIMLNKPPLLSVPGGLLLCPEAFQWFMKGHPEYKNSLAVQTGFLSLGLHQVGPQGETDFRFEQTGNQQMHQGIVLSNPAIVYPDKVNVFQMQTGKTTPLSAIELIHKANTNHQLIAQSLIQPAQALLYLSGSGKWQTPPESQAPTAGVKPRG